MNFSHQLWLSSTHHISLAQLRFRSDSDSATSITIQQTHPASQHQNQHHSYGIRPNQTKSNQIKLPHPSPIQPNPVLPSQNARMSSIHFRPRFSRLYLPTYLCIPYGPVPILQKHVPHANNKYLVNARIVPKA